MPKVIETQDPAPKSINEGRALDQEYGLYDPRNKSFGGDKELLDNQQRYDNSIQESEIELVPVPADDQRRSLDDKNFANDFFEFSKSYHDNENGPPGIDEDYGMVNPLEEPIHTVDDDDAATDEVDLGESLEENLALRDPMAKELKKMKATSARPESKK